MKTLRNFIRKIIVENYQPTYRWLYHGTTIEAAKNIENHGFDLSLVGKKSGDKKNPGVSFTIDDNIASEHAIWGAAKGNFAKGPAIIVISTNNLRIMKGTQFNELWNQYNSHSVAVEDALRQGYDGVEVWDEDTGDGIEEMEVLIIRPREIVVSHINELDIEDFPELMDEY